MALGRIRIPGCGGGVPLPQVSCGSNNSHWVSSLPLRSLVTGSDYVITLNLICPILKMGIIITPSKFYRAVMNEIKTSS